MKCPHCNGGVVELFITSKQCERCDGRGNLTVTVNEHDGTIATKPWQRGDGPDPLTFAERYPGLAAWLPEMGVDRSTPTCEQCGGTVEEHPVVDQLRKMLPERIRHNNVEKAWAGPRSWTELWAERRGPSDRLAHMEKAKAHADVQPPGGFLPAPGESKLKGVTAADFTMPEPAFRLDLSAAREQMHRGLARDDERLREAVTAHEAVERLGLTVLASSWSKHHGDNGSLRVDVVETDSGATSLYIPAETIAERYRTVYVRGDDLRKRLSRIEVKTWAGWKTLRTFPAPPEAE